jgi:hypothetical protein
MAQLDNSIAVGDPALHELGLSSGRLAISHSPRRPYTGLGAIAVSRPTLDAHSSTAGAINKPRPSLRVPLAVTCARDEVYLFAVCSVLMVDEGLQLGVV